MKLFAEKIDVDAKIPVREHPHDAGIDFFSLKNETLNPGERKIISTGIRINVPAGYVLFLKDKSGLAIRNGVHIMAGVIDEEYRGEIKVVVINLSTGRISFAKGEKVCQGVLLPVALLVVEEANKISIETSRGEGSFGSTGDGISDVEDEKEAILVEDEKEAILVKDKKDMTIVEDEYKSQSILKQLSNIKEYIKKVEEENNMLKRKISTKNNNV